MNPKQLVHRMSATRAVLLAVLGLIAAIVQTPVARGGSATWLSSPGSGDWNTAGNWTPGVVPNAAGDTATFNVTRTVDVSLSANTEVNGIVFSAGASAYTIAVSPNITLTISGTGIANNSGLTQNFVTAVDGLGNQGTINFTNSATAGTQTVFTNNGATVAGGNQGIVIFSNGSSAARATFINNGVSVLTAIGGETEFTGSATAANGTFINYGGTTSGPDGGGFDEEGVTFFFNSSSGANGTFINYGGNPNVTGGGVTGFFDNSSAGNATLIAYGGTGGSAGGAIEFLNNSTGGTATVKVYGNGALDISFHNAPGVTIGSIEGTGNVFLGANNLTVGTNNLSTLFSGVIHDGGFNGGVGGSLTKTGTGTLILTGANTYTGSTTVNQGSLIVNGSIASPNTFVQPSGLLGGTGMIGGNLINGGVVSPGDAPGTLTVNGNFTQSSAGTLFIGIGGYSSGLLSIGGKASLGGALQLAVADNSLLNVGEKITILSAAGGVSGSFSTVQELNRTLIGAEVFYSPNSVFIEGFQIPFSFIAKTPNQQAVAYALDKSFSDPRAAKLIYSLDHESFDKALQDLDRISPDSLTSIYQVAVSEAKEQAFTLQRRLEDVREGSNGFSAAGFAMNGAPAQTSSYEVAGPSGPDGKSGKMALTPAPDNRWGVFVTGVGEFASLGDTGNAHGYDLTNAGFTLGVDFKATPNFVIGLATGYDYSSADLTQGGRVIVDGGKLALYTSYFTGGFYADAAVQGGYNSYDTSRAGFGGTARGDSDGGEFTAIFGTGYDFKKGALTIGPTANFGYTYLGLGSFTERGSLAALNFPNQDQESITSTIGAKASYDWKLGHVTVRPEVRAGWQHEYSDATLGITSRFASGAGPDFLVHGPGTGRDSLVLNAGVAILWTDRVSTYVYYDGELARTNYEANYVSGGFRIGF